MDVSGIPNVTLPTYPFTTSGGAEVLGLQQPQASQTIAAFNAFGNPVPKPVATPVDHATGPHHARRHRGPVQREHRGGQRDWHRRAGRSDDARC